ncbi:hypothetical protein LEP1GSC202_0788 [Leptospira yanagawae serovar Saopaulo str. Sao Paulo = ATCC 700523]|uniref:Uncharacterized protein n=1 Tax=Leptospira yanagawae serovar Saopaulo str. Sao Paulo = ATCC 700523 TaxID=1249483 RepID=A0A5E8HF20_9LEPT|nr:hypothetical protein LEP1GSC202_0788 [Leptospira yanagawae serovar Saopaulo str. Sao Paulo = ATCC 700523]
MACEYLQKVLIKSGRSLAPRIGYANMESGIIYSEILIFYFNLQD